MGDTDTLSGRQVLLNSHLVLTESPEGPTLHTTNNVNTEGGNFHRTLPEIIVLFCGTRQQGKRVKLPG